MTPRQFKLADFPQIETSILRVVVRPIGDEPDADFFSLSVGVLAAAANAIPAEEISFLQSLFARNAKPVLHCCSSDDLSGCWTIGGHLATLGWACVSFEELQRLAAALNKLAGRELFTLDQRQKAIDSVNNDPGRAYHASIFAFRFAGIPSAEQYELHQPLTPQLRAQALAAGGHAARKLT